MQFNQDESDVLETQATETEQETNTEVEAEETTEAPEDDWKAKAEELERKNRQLYERLKKQSSVPLTDAGLSEYDILALKNSNITEKDDLDTLKEYARKLNLSIADALEDKYVKSVLADKAEERRTARATETRSPRGIARSSGEELLRRAEREGDVPSTDAEMRALIEARLERKRRK